MRRRARGAAPAAAVLVVAAAGAIAIVAALAGHARADGASVVEPPIIIRVKLSTRSPVRLLLLQEAGARPADPAAGEALALAVGSYEIRAGGRAGEVDVTDASGRRIVFPRGLRIAPRDATRPAFSLEGRTYHGELELSWIERAQAGAGGGGDGERGELVAVNRVDIETYVEGVLAGEVLPGWEMEALKAQAVASRTYALYRMGLAAGRSYDVDDTVLSQRYSGENGVDAFSAAVRATAGQVLTYGGAIIKAHYFSSGGGITEGDEEVWPGGGDEPYLEGTNDFDELSPHYFWPSPLALWGDEFVAKLGLEATFPAWVEPALRDGDKVLAYRVRTATGSAVFTREQIRFRLGLKSPRFTITLVRGDETGVLSAPPGSLQRKAGLPAIEGCAAVRGSGREVIGYRLTLGKELLVRGRPVTESEELSAATLVILDGVGYGHGVGLSQWGAQGMALMRDGSGSPVYDYVDILQHYYNGVEVVGNYGLPLIPAVTSAISSAISSPTTEVPAADAAEAEEARELQSGETL